MTLNTAPSGDLFVLQSTDGDVLVKLSDLRSLGIQVPEDRAHLVEGEAYVPLRSVPGLRFRVDPAKLLLELTADPAILPSRSIEMAQGQHARLVRPDAPTGYLNYSLQAGSSSVGEPQYVLSTEAGLRLGDVLLQSDSTSVQDSTNGSHTARLMSRAVWDDVHSLRRVIAGDFFSASNELGTSANLGGINISKQYGLDPYLLRQPLSNLRARVAVPSELEVLVDGQRVRLERVQPGEVQLRDLYGFGGARDVQLVLRDAFGRVQKLDYSVYFTDQPLRAGLHEYDYGAGFLRRDYGTRSNAYGPLAYSAFHRYGVSDAVTLGLRAEGRQGLTNAGAFGTFVLGSAGVLSASLASSRLHGLDGRAVSLSYNYQQRNFSAGFSTRRDSAGYATLTDPLTVSNRRAESSVYGSLYLPNWGTLTLSHSRLSVHATPLLPAGVALSPLQPQRVTSLRYSVPLVSGTANLNLSISHVNDTTGSRNELLASLIVFLDRDRTLQSALRRSEGNTIASTRLSQNPGIGEGVGYDIAVDKGSGESNPLQLRLATQLNTQRAIFRAEAERSHGDGSVSHGERVSVAGSLALIGGRLHMSRPILDSFALVQADGLPGLPVTLNGQRAGRTDSDGELLLPSLASYYDNQIAIDQSAIPMEYTVDHLSQRVAPMYRSGATVGFDLTRVRTLSGRLVSTGGQPMDLQEFVVTDGSKEVRSRTGRDGEIYLENLSAGRHAARTVPAGDGCRFEIIVPDSTDSFVELGDVTCR